MAGENYRACLLIILFCSNLQLISTHITLRKSKAVATSIIQNSHYVCSESKSNIFYSVDKVPCLTLSEYASESETFFTSNTVFYFRPGSHTLDVNLILVDVHNLTLQGLDDNDKAATVWFDTLVGIVWENCSNIQISSIAFNLEGPGNFTYILVFQQTYFVQISKITVLGNGSTGCSFIRTVNSMLNIVDSMFFGIEGHVGAALTMMQSSSVTLSGNTTFTRNVALCGGAFYLMDSALILDGRSIFGSNGAIEPELDEPDQDDRFILNDKFCKIKFSCNYGSGGAIYSINSSVVTKQDSYFYNNFARVWGGVLVTDHSNVTVQDNTELVSNIAFVGGALYFRHSIIKFYDSVILFNNSAASDGGALFTVGVKLFFNHRAVSTDSTQGIISFRQNAARFGGSISSRSSNFTFTGTVLFIENWAMFIGGAIALDSDSKLIFISSTTTSFIRNYARDVGGALFVDDGRCSSTTANNIIVKNECFFAIEGPYDSLTNISLFFYYNSAKTTGSTLYGGELNRCKLRFTNSCSANEEYYYGDNALQVFTAVSTIILHNNSKTNMSAPAQDIKFCDNETYHELHLYPGQLFNVSLVAVLPQTVDSVFKKVVASPWSWQDLYSFNGGIQDLTYFSQVTIGSHSPYVDGSCADVSFRCYAHADAFHILQVFKLFPNCLSYPGLSVTVFILPCPLGFDVPSNDHKCTCDNKLSKFTPNCYIDTLSVGRMENNFWVSKENETIIIIHEYRCPLEYCKTSHTNVSLDHSYVQCNFERNGTLCGHCMTNFSLALGSLHCLKCRNSYIALVMPFALVGVFLIASIFLLRLTVAEGTLNGLIFYINIIQANHQSFFVEESLNFCTYFISWLNLDLGIETCFYDGMDMYAYSWLQFLFPFYIWFLIGMIVYATRYSKTLSEILGQLNPVAVLATLFLLSYSKILMAIITPLSWTYLTYYNSTIEYYHRVWLYDGSVGFFEEPKHIALGSFAILTLILFVLPFIFLLTCGHWLQGCSTWRIFSWVNKMKPIMDAYHAPYKKHARHWTGLLLVSRTGLLLMFAINTLGDESINIVAITSVTAVLLTLKGRIYEFWFNDVLESISLLNLCIFSTVTLYLNEMVELDDSRKELQKIASTISVSIAFIAFISILFYHIVLRIKSTSLWKESVCKHTSCGAIYKIIVTSCCHDDNAETQIQPTITALDINNLREELIESHPHTGDNK